MKAYCLRLMKLLFGLLLYAVGIIVTIHAEIGYAPWDVFHVGVAKTLGVSLGSISIGVGLIVVVLCVLLGETLGLGTILNMVLIGTFMDIIIKLDVIPVATSFWMGLGMFIVGMVIISLATYYYISSGFGAGPRDSLMVALTRKFGWSVAVSRTVLEFSATAGGYFLGGKVGVGTVISVLFVGWFVQSTFQLFRFNATDVQHETLKETWEHLRGSMAH